MIDETMFFEMCGRLLPWYLEHQRDLPWRHTADPYRIWISEIMLQQTRVEAVKAYYTRFLEALPTIRSLAACPDGRLLKLWEGLGYYSRARNLKKAAELLTASGNPELPADHDALLSLPGIGPYTAGAIASIAFGLPYPAVDGNVMRVLARVRNDARNIADPYVRKETEADLTGLYRTGTDRQITDPGLLNQSLMELGALVCIPNGQPHCEACPLAELCAAHQSGRELELPVVEKNRSRRIEERTVFVIRDGDRTGVRRRPEKGLLAGLYEFPNVKGHLSEEEAVRRIAAYGFAVLQIRRLADARHVFSHIEWHMAGYEVKVASPARRGNVIFQNDRTLLTKYAIPEAFAVYKAYLRE